MNIFDNRRLQAVPTFRFVIDLDIGKTLGPIDGDELGIGINLGTRHAAVFFGTARHTQTNHTPTVHRSRGGEDFEVHVFHYLSEFSKGELNAHVRLVRAIQPHRGSKIHHGEGIGQLNIKRIFKDDTDHAFKHVADFLLRHEGGFAINLRKFRLTIGT